MFDVWVAKDDQHDKGLWQLGFFVQKGWCWMYQVATQYVDRSLWRGLWHLVFRDVYCLELQGGQ